MEHKIILHLKLVRKNGEPIQSLSTHVKLWDSDIIADDYLGSMLFDKNGEGIATITRDDIRSFDSPWEKYPDIYFEVFKGDEIIYKSEVYQDLKVEEGESQEDGIHFDLGTFVIEEK